MPTIITRGSMSARAFGLTGVTLCPLDGTKGIFQNNYSNTTRTKFTYAGCTSTTSGVGTASTSTYGGAAAGNSTRGIFKVGSCAVTTRNKHTYSTCTSTACGVGAQSARSSCGYAAGNSTRGIFTLGAYACGCVYVLRSARDKYTYASCTSTASGVAAASSVTTRGAAVGPSCSGYFHLGQVNGCGTAYTALRNKYSYACCTNVNTNFATYQSRLGFAAGNSTKGIFAVGQAACIGVTAIRCKLTYATNVSTTSGVGAASISAYNGAATGNSTRGIFALGTGVGAAEMNKYTYASCSSVVITSLPSSLNGNGATSWATGVNCA